MTYYLRDAPAEGEQLLLSIRSEAGELIRQLELTAGPGILRDCSNPAQPVYRYGR